MTCSREIFFSIHVRMELSLCCLPDYAFHTSGFLCQDTDSMKLDTVTQIYAVLGHS